MTSSPGFRIVTFRPELAHAFGALNREWIERFFALEAADRKTMDHPQEAIMDTGGEIWFALDEQGVPQGTVALLPTAPGEYELTKMAVTPAAQGRGLGELLGRAVIAHARAIGARKLFLYTNSALAPAIRLYGRLGFAHRPMPEGVVYARADVYMEHEQ